MVEKERERALRVEGETQKTKERKKKLTFFENKKTKKTLGVVLWELWTGLEPWADVSPVGVVGAVGFGGATLPLGDEEEEEGEGAAATTTTTTGPASASASTLPRVSIGDGEGQIPPAIAKLIRKCWAPLPSDRPSFSSCIDELNAFLKGLLAAAANASTAAVARQ